MIKINFMDWRIRLDAKFFKWDTGSCSHIFEAVVEIRPPGVQMLPFFSTTDVTTKLQTEGYIGFITEMVFNMF